MPLRCARPVQKKNNKLGAEAQYYMGLIAYQLKKIVDAALEFSKMEYLYSDYPYWIDKANLMLAKIYKNNQEAEKYKEVCEKLKNTNNPEIKLELEKMEND